MTAPNPRALAERIVREGLHDDGSLVIKKPRGMVEVEDVIHAGMVEALARYALAREADLRAIAQEMREAEVEADSLAYYADMIERLLPPRGAATGEE